MKLEKVATHIKLSLDTRYKDTKTFPLIFRLAHNRKTTSIGTGHQIAVSDWSEKRQKIRPPFKDTEFLCPIGTYIEIVDEVCDCINHWNSIQIKVFPCLHPFI